jgi:metal-responsive CopG/Arc/MetJ family transcriptional regulator
MAQPAPTPVRLPDELLAKFEVVAKHQRRKRGELIRMLVEDAVAAHEAKHGEIKLRSSPPPSL